MSENRQDAQTLDALVWATLTEFATVARLAARLVRDHSQYGAPTQKVITESIRATSPPRGRAGPMFDLVEAEFHRQRPIYWKRKHAHSDKVARDEEVTQRSYRINAAYASIFGRPIYGAHRDYRGVSRGHYPSYGTPEYETYQKAEQEERASDKGDPCVAIIKHQDRIVALTKAYESHLLVRHFGSDKVQKTTLRATVKNFGELFAVLGGSPVLGALAHGRRVEIDYPGRCFIIHDEDGDTHTSPWLSRRNCENPNGNGQINEETIIVDGREIVDDR